MFNKYQAVTGEFNKIVDGWKDELQAQGCTPEQISEKTSERLAALDEEIRHDDPRFALELIVVAAHKHGLLSGFFTND